MGVLLIIATLGHTSGSGGGGGTPPSTPGTLVPDSPVQVLYNGQPVLYNGQPVYYSHLTLIP